MFATYQFFHMNANKYDCTIDADQKSRNGTCLGAVVFCAACARRDFVAKFTGKEFRV